MAITDLLPGLQVSVARNGRPMQEHIDYDLTEEQRTITRYIEAKSGENFQIRFDVARKTNFKGDALRCEVFLDGQSAPGPLLKKDKVDSENLVDIREGLKVGAGLVKKYRFAGLDIVSYSNLTHGEASTVKDIGSIVVIVSKVWVKKKIDNGYEINALQDSGIVSEKAVKGRTVSHSVGLGEAEYTGVGGTTFWDWKPVKNIPSPTVTFVFLYRSNEALKSLLIIPRTPEPPSPQRLEDKDWNDMTADEQAKVMNEYRALKRAADAPPADVKVKLEHSDDNPRPRKVARPKAGDTQLEIDEDGGFRESSTASIPAPEVIELD